MFKKFKNEERGEVVAYLLILFAILSLLWVYAPTIKKIAFGSTDDSVAGVDEVTKPMEEKPTTPTTPTDPPPPPVLEKPKPKTYSYVSISVIDSYKLQSRSYVNFGGVKPNSILTFSLDKSVLGEDMKKINKYGTNLRFFDKEFKELPFYIGQWGGTAQNADGDGTMIWIRTPSNKEIENVLMVFGDPSLSSKSDGTKFFKFFDDFSSTSHSQTLWKNISGSQIQDGILTLKAGDSLISNQTFSEPASHSQNTIVFSKEIEQKAPFEFGYTNFYVQHNQENKTLQGSYYTSSNGLSFKNDSENFADAVPKISPFDNAFFNIGNTYNDPNTFQYYTRLYDWTFALIRNVPKKSYGSIYVKAAGSNSMHISEIFVLEEEVYTTKMAEKKGAFAPVVGIERKSFEDTLGIVR